MDKKFWHEKWESNQIGFHEPEANPLLVKHIDSFSLPVGQRIFIPLCGKTLDIGWLLSKGYKIVGVELVEMAVKQLFEELDLQATVLEIGKFKCYSAENIQIFVGDIFELSSKQLGPVDVIYDRAAFVALPEETRKRYVTHIAEITQRATQLLITYEYQQKITIAGPPFSTSKQEVTQFYSNIYELSLLASEAVEGGLKGQAAIEYVWQLKSKSSVA